jgi:hypothetical protein
MEATHIVNGSQAFLPDSLRMRSIFSRPNIATTIGNSKSIIGTEIKTRVLLLAVEIASTIIREGKPTVAVSADTGRAKLELSALSIKRKLS